MFYTVQGIAYGKKAIDPERIMLLSGNWRNESKGTRQRQKRIRCTDWKPMVCR